MYLSNAYVSRKYTLEIYRSLHQTTVLHCSHVRTATPFANKETPTQMVRAYKLKNREPEDEN